ncbi:MAG: universal stress protein [Bdellovibrio sp.]|nr:universal stress protein [Bdellovibrio sp.]
MASKFMLIADDVLDTSPEGIKRSNLVQRIGLNLSDKLKSPVKLLYVQNLLDENSQSEQIEKIKASLHERFRAEGKKLKIIEARGNPVDEIFRIETGSPAPGLVVMRTKAKKGIERLLLGSVAEEVVRNAVVPVLVVGPNVTGVPAGKSRILVATDLTKNSRRAEAYAMKLAKALKAEVVLIHSVLETLRVADQYAAASGTTFLDQTTIDTIVMKTTEALMKKVKLFKANRVKCSFILDESGPTSQSALVTECAQGYQYLVMGTHGRSSFVRAFLGSTAKETLVKSPIPVIVVRSHNK